MGPAIIVFSCILGTLFGRMIIRFFADIADLVDVTSEVQSNTRTLLTDIIVGLVIGIGLVTVEEVIWRRTLLRYSFSLPSIAILALGTLIIHKSDRARESWSYSAFQAGLAVIAGILVKLSIESGE